MCFLKSNCDTHFRKTNLAHAELNPGVSELDRKATKVARVSLSQRRKLRKLQHISAGPETSEGDRLFALFVVAAVPDLMDGVAWKPKSCKMLG